METEKELQQVREKIKDLKEKEDQLVDKLIEEKESFNEKFKVWKNSDKGKILGDLFQLKEKSTIIREYLRKYDYINRMEEVNLFDFMCDDLGWMTGDFKGAEDFYTKEQQVEIRKVAEEMMKHNIKGVIFDW